MVPLHPNGSIANPMNFNSAIFEKNSVEALKQIILTPEDGRSTEERWRRETPYTASLLVEHLALAAGDTIVDFGCGIGRLAKEILSRVDVRVIGVDISKSMLVESLRYVDDPRFCPMPYAMFVDLCAKGRLQFTHAFAIYVLQHCERPVEAIGAFRQGGARRVMAVNMVRRVMPVVEATDRRYPWVDDGVSVSDEILRHFPGRTAIPLDPGIMSLTDETWAAVFAR
jgi:SAM-dependent methyltransferase